MSICSNGYDQRHRRGLRRLPQLHAEVQLLQEGLFGSGSGRAMSAAAAPALAEVDERTWLVSVGLVLSLYTVNSSILDDQSGAGGITLSTPATSSSPAFLIAVGAVAHKMNGN